jgi:hypothetical protein
MTGNVIGVNGDRCAVKVPSGFTILECLGAHSTERGDVIVGDLESLGSETLINPTRGERISVFIEDWTCSPYRAHRFLFP